MSAIIDASERWQAFVDSQPWQRGSLDQSSYLSFIRAGSLGIGPQEALETIAARIKGAGDHPKLTKLNQQIRRAYAFANAADQSGDYSQLPKAARPSFAAAYAEKFAERASASIDQAWLRKRSPVKVPYLLTPSEFLAAVYELGDKLLIFTDYRSQGQSIWQRCAFKVERDELDCFVRGHENGVWFLSNPVDGRAHFNDRQQKMSRRSEESVTAFRYAVLESDCQPPEQWLRILVQLPLPIVSIASSGGKSLHALVRVNASSKTDWDQLIGAIKPKLINIGADPAALTAVRLTRLPNCYRGERLQELLYLDPTPTDDPIWRGHNGHC